MLEVVLTARKDLAQTLNFTNPHNKIKTSSAAIEGPVLFHDDSWLGWEGGSVGVVVHCLSPKP